MTSGNSLWTGQDQFLLINPERILLPSYEQVDFHFRVYDTI